MPDTNKVRKVSIIKNTEKPIQNYRFISQTIFMLITIWIGIEYAIFIFRLEGNALEVYRPSGVESFLPISALMSTVYYLRTGIIHAIHPAGFMIFAGIVAMSFYVGKSFCSWVCPVGFISELVGDFGEKIFKKKISMPKFLDIPLRTLKYLLLLFFASSIIPMSAIELRFFLDSDYNIAADIKMFEFFRSLSQFSFIVLMSLLVLSVLFKNFWCRYLCPYGALLGFIGLFSIHKISRNTETCIDCSLCDKACPSKIPVSKRKLVISDECTSCVQCIDVCPVKDTLEFRTLPAKTYSNKLVVLITAVIIFTLILSAGIISGKWNNSVSTAKYKELYENRNSLGH